jgi:hypothetical protein
MSINVRYVMLNNYYADILSCIYNDNSVDGGPIFKFPSWQHKLPNYLEAAIYPSLKLVTYLYDICILQVVHISYVSTPLAYTTAGTCGSALESRHYLLLLFYIRFLSSNLSCYLSSLVLLARSPERFPPSKKWRRNSVGSSAYLHGLFELRGQY